MIYFEQPVTGTTPVPGTRTVFASFGLEALSNDYYIHVDGTGTYNFHIESRNNRTMVMHGIVNYLRTGDIAGRILDRTNPSVGVAGATIYAIPISGATIGVRNVYSATSDSNGNYDIAGIPPGAYDVVSYRTGYNRQVNTFPFYVEGDVTDHVTLQMLALNPATITGTVTDGATTKPISGALVSWQSSDPNISPVQVFTDANGNYSAQIPSTTAGINYTGTASATGYGSQSVTQAVVAGTIYSGVNFVLGKQPGTVTGKVYDTTTNNAIAGAVVTPLLNGTAVTGVTPVTTGSDGTYTFSLPGGTYSLQATAAGYATNSISVTVIAGGSLTGQNIPLTPQKPGYLGGLVQTSTGGPLSGVSISITGATTATATSGAVSSPGAPKGDGTPQNWNIALSPGTYSVTFTAGYGTTTVTNLTVTANAFTRVPTAKSTFTTGELIGLVKTSPNTTPLAGGTVTVTDTNGTVVGTATTTSTTTSPGSPSGDGSPINYSIPLSPGTYTVTISRTGFATKTFLKVVITAGAVTREDYPFPALNTFSAGLHFFSVPYDYSGTSWDTLFNGFTPNNRSRIAVWQQSLGQYVLDPTSPADAPRLGYGYWVRLKAATDITVPGAAPTSGTISVPLTAGWNMIGVPSTTAINVTSLKFVNPQDATTPITWAQATSIQFNLVSGSLYSYDPSAGQYTTTDSSGQLQPWTGYWIRANDNTTLLIPTAGP
jgi:hypothetical protein